jgi:two-component system, NarL family, nitrate/nitrite response regulator NarL
MRTGSVRWQPGPVTLRCLLVDDNEHFLSAARDLLEREGVVVAGTAGRIEEAVRLAAELRPDVALVDINLGGESGFELAERLRPIPVIMISTHAGDDYADLVEAGPAIGFLGKVALSAGAVRDLLTAGGR